MTFIIGTKYSEFAVTTIKNSFSSLATDLGLLGKFLMGLTATKQHHILNLCIYRM
jgi:hypothetical protein